MHLHSPIGCRIDDETRIAQCAPALRAGRVVLQRAVAHWIRPLKPSTGPCRRVHPGSGFESGGIGWSSEPWSRRVTLPSTAGAHDRDRRRATRAPDARRRDLRRDDHSTGRANRVVRVGRRSRPGRGGPDQATQRHEDGGELWTCDDLCVSPRARDHSTADGRNRHAHGNLVARMLACAGSCSAGHRTRRSRCSLRCAPPGACRSESHNAARSPDRAGSCYARRLCATRGTDDCACQRGCIVASPWPNWCPNMPPRIPPATMAPIPLGLSC